jgi:hypothetical protein
MVAAAATTTTTTIILLLILILIIIISTDSEWGLRKTRRMRDRHFEWSPCFSLLTYKQYVICGIFMTCLWTTFLMFSPEQFIGYSRQAQSYRTRLHRIYNLNKAKGLSKIHLLYNISTPQRKRFHVAHASQFRRLPCNYRLYERRNLALGWRPTAWRSYRVS